MNDQIFTDTYPDTRRLGGNEGVTIQTLTPKQIHARTPQQADRRFKGWMVIAASLTLAGVMAIIADHYSGRYALERQARLALEQKLATIEHLHQQEIRELENQHQNFINGVMYREYLGGQ